MRGNLRALLTSAITDNEGNLDAQLDALSAEIDNIESKINDVIAELPNADDVSDIESKLTEIAEGLY